MPDPLTLQQRHLCMSHIRSKDTSPELKLRHELWRRGYRYRTNVRRLPGTPDIVLGKYRTVIFVNGCFWHGHKGCRKYTVPKSTSSSGRRRSPATGSATCSTTSGLNQSRGASSPYGNANSTRLICRTRPTASKPNLRQTRPSGKHTASAAGRTASSPLSRHAGAAKSPPSSKPNSRNSWTPR